MPGVARCHGQPVSGATGPRGDWPRITADQYTSISAILNLNNSICEVTTTGWPKHHSRDHLGPTSSLFETDAGSGPIALAGGMPSQMDAFSTSF